MLKTIRSDDDIKIYENEKHFKVYAGPGAGKTHLIIENIKKNLCISPSFIFFISFHLLSLLYRPQLQYRGEHIQNGLYPHPQAC